MFATSRASAGIIGPLASIGAILAWLLVGSSTLAQEAGVTGVPVGESGRAWLSVVLPWIMFGLSPVAAWLGAGWVIGRTSWQQPPSQLPAGGLIGVGLVLWLVPQLAARLSASVTTGVVPTAIGYGIGIVLALVIASRLVRGPSLRCLTDGLRAIAILLPIVSMVAIVSGWIARQLGYQTGEVAHTTLESILEGGPTAGVLIVTAVAGASVVEEVVFRLLFHGGMRRVLSRDRFGDVFKVSVVVGIVFGLIHFGAVPGHALPGLIVLGIGLGIAREGLGLWAAVVAHAAFNAWNILLALVLNG